MQKFSMKDLPCQKVVVYEDRAEVKRSIKTKLNQGEHTIVITNVSSNIDKESLKVKGTGEATVIDVVCEVKRVSESDQSHDENTLADKLKSEIKELEKMEDLTNFKMDRVTMQKGLLNDFAGHLAKPSTGMRPSDAALYEDEKNDTIDSKTEIETFMSFMSLYNDRVEVLDNSKYEVISDLVTIREKLDIARNNLLKLNISRSIPNESVEISILVESKYDNSEIELFISYLVSNASWSPRYDIRVITEDQSMKVNYNGMITQSTGEDWNDAKIVLSTSVPSIGVNLPELQTQTVKLRLKEPKENEPKSLMDRKSKSFDDVHLMVISLPQIQQETLSVKKNGFTSTFEIPRNATILSDSNAHKVSIGIIDLKAEFEFVSVPKNNPSVFIRARVVNESNYMLLAGQANDFLDNTFVAKTELSTCNPLEEFCCLLGTDSSIKIDYKPIKKSIGQTGLLSRFTNITYVQTIEVKNTTSNNVKLLIQDNLPLSNDEKIQVKLLEPVLKNNPSVRLNKMNNLEFNLTLPALKTEEIVIKYNIEYHADQQSDFF